jgi:hypothetical protein
LPSNDAHVRRPGTARHWLFCYRNDDAEKGEISKRFEKADVIPRASGKTRVKLEKSGM